MNTIIRLIENALHPFRVLGAYFGRFFRFGGKKFKLTLAGKLSIAFFICFAIFITVICIIRIFDPDAYFFKSITQHLFNKEFLWVDIPLYFLSALLISIGLYWGIRVAIRERPSLYPEIDQCWEPIEKWRQKQNLDWNEFNRYLVLGPTLDISKAMHAEMKDRKIGALPAGVNEWMHWFGTHESLYLHLKKVCNIGSRLDKVGTGKKRSSVDPANTLQASVGVPDWSASVGVDDVTAEVDESIGGYGGSLDPNDSIDTYGSGEFNSSDIEQPSDAAEAKNDDEEIGDDGDTPMDRVRYLCKMIQAKTEGQMPFNGIVVVIPFDKFMAGENYKTISDAVKKDLLEIRRQTDIAFPVSFVFCSMENDQGFPKLQNLLGAQRSSTGRFGAGCRITDVPVIDQKNLEIQVERACLSFEDWVVNRWGKSNQLSRAAQNKELFKMLVRVRQKLQPNLMHLMRHSLLWTESESPCQDASDLTLAGCYFVSTGEHASERGFLNGVFLKCDEFAETASWGDRVLNRDRLFSVMGTLMFLSAFLVIIGVGVFIYLNK